MTCLATEDPHDRVDMPIVHVIHIVHHALRDVWLSP